jgi:hypothetical protein
LCETTVKSNRYLCSIGVLQINVIKTRPDGSTVNWTIGRSGHTPKTVSHGNQTSDRKNQLEPIKLVNCFRFWKTGLSFFIKKKSEFVYISL